LLSNDVSKIVPNFISSCTTDDTQIAPRNWEQPKARGTDFIEAGTDHQGDEVLWTSQDGNFNSGLHVKEDDDVLVNMEVVNYRKDKKEFYLTYEIEYLPGLVGSNAQGQLLDITACDEKKKVTISRTGPTNTTSGKHLVYKDGSIIDASKCFFN
jgi:hypothetical protein